MEPLSQGGGVTARCAEARHKRIPAWNSHASAGGWRGSGPRRGSSRLMGGAWPASCRACCSVVIGEGRDVGCRCGRLAVARGAPARHGCGGRVVMALQRQEPWSMRKQANEEKKKRRWRTFAQRFDRQRCCSVEDLGRLRSLHRVAKATEGNSLHSTRQLRLHLTCF